MLLALALSCDDPAPPPAAPPPTKPPLDTGIGEAPEEASAPTEANRRPRFKKLKLAPAEPTVLSTIDARVEVVDPEGDMVDVDLTWFVNDEEVRRGGRQLAATHFAKGDQVVLEVELSDGEHRFSKRTDPLVVVNAPPDIRIPQRITSIDGLRLAASDPDEEPITWRVEDAPPGFSISGDGVVSYKGSMEVTETTTYTTRIIAEDPDGAYAAWEMGLTVEAAKQPSRSFTRGEAGAKADDG